MAANETRKAVLDLFVRGAKEAKRDIEDVRKAVEDLKKATGGASSSTKASAASVSSSVSSISAAFKGLAIILTPVLGAIQILTTAFFSLAQMLLSTVLTALHALVGVLGNVLVKALGAAGEAAVALLQRFNQFGMSIIKMTSEFEQLRTTLKVVFRDAAEGNKVFNFIKKIALEAPFTVRQVAEMGARLKAVGIDPRLERQGVAVLTSISDLAAGMGRNIYDAFFAFKEAAAEGNFISLMRRFSITKANIETTLSAIGEKVDFSTVQGTIDTLTKFIKINFGGASEELNKTLFGIKNRAQDYWEQFQAMIGESSFGDTVKKQAEKVLAVIENLFSSGEINVIAGRISDFFTNIVSGLITVGDAILGIANWGKVGKGFLDVLTDIGEFFSGNTFKNAVTNSFNWIKKQFNDLSKGMSMGKGFLENAEIALGNIWEKLKPPAEEFFNWVYENIQKLAEETKKLFFSAIEWIANKFPNLSALTRMAAGASWVGAGASANVATAVAGFYGRNVAFAQDNLSRFTQDEMQGGTRTALENERRYAEDVKTARRILEAMGRLAGVPNVPSKEAPSDGLPSDKEIAQRMKDWAKAIDAQNTATKKEQRDQLDSQRREDAKKLWEAAGEAIKKVTEYTIQKFNQLASAFEKLASTVVKVTDKFEKLRDARYAIGDTIQSVKDKFALLTGASESDVRSSNIAKWLAEARDSRTPLTRRVSVAGKAFEASAGAVGSIDAELKGLYKTAGQFGGDQKDWAERSRSRGQINELEKQRADEIKRLEEAQKEYLAALDKQHSEAMQKEEQSYNELKRHTELLGVAASALSGSPEFVQREITKSSLHSMQSLLRKQEFKDLPEAEVRSAIEKLETELTYLEGALENRVFPDIAKKIQDSLAKSAAETKISDMAEGITKAGEITGTDLPKDGLAQALAHAIAAGMGKVAVQFPDKVTIHVDAANFTFEGAGSAEADSGIPQTTAQ